MKRTALKRRTPLKRGKPLARRGRKALREVSDLDAMRAIVRERNGGSCEIWTPSCEPGAHYGAHVHHVFPSDRDRGVHDPERCLYVCAPSHQFIHEHPAWARTRGYLLHDGDDAA